MIPFKACSPGTLPAPKRATTPDPQHLNNNPGTDTNTNTDTMVRDATLRNHHPGSPLYGGRTVTSSGNSGSLLRRLTSLTRRSKSQPMLNTSRYTPSASHTPPTTSPSPASHPDRMALAAAQTASLKVIATTSITTNANTLRPVSGTLPTPPAATIHAPAASSPSTTAPLAVHVEIRFPSLDSQSGIPVYVNEYASSDDLAATNRLCKGLLRRLHHCSTELITRKDSRALKQHRRLGQETTTKPLCYEIHYRVLRQGAGVWAERTFFSYQRQPLSGHDAHEIILATHRMVGLFLRRHDPSFHWTDVPATKTIAFAPRPDEPELVHHTVDNPLPLSCVPQSRFLDESQSFEFTPGYAINLTFRSRCHGRKQYEWKRVINLQSKQNAPLNLALAENLLWDTFNAVNSTLSARREAFLEEHKACDFLEGVVGCQHFGEDALDIELGIENKLGPNFGHLKRSIESKLGLFRDPDARDCQEFFLSIHSSLVHARDGADSQIGALPDFDLRILTLSAPTWSVENPARFVLDTTTSYSRRSVEAILDRVQTGVSDVLRNRDCTIHLVAYKRGHLVLDKALIARPLPPKPALFPMTTAVKQAGPIVARLTERIHRDLNAVCKDTCSLDGISENTSDDDLGRIDASQADDSLPKCSSLTSPVHGAFEQTIILEDPAAFEEEEPAVPAPRVVELPDDVFVDALEHSPSSPSPAPCTRRRAFPLMPEKFTLPHAIKSSPSVEFVTAQSVLPITEEPANTTAPSAVAACSFEAPVESVVDFAPAEAAARNAAGLPGVPVEAPSLAEHDINLFVEDPIDKAVYSTEEPTLPVIEAIVEETTVDDVFEAAGDVDDVAKGITGEDEVNEAAVPEPTTDLSSDDEMDNTKSAIEADIDNDIDNAYDNTPQLEEQSKALTPPLTLDSPPMFITFDDIEEQPSVELRFGRPDSPTVGTPLETIPEYDSGPGTEFAFELPSYDQFDPAVQDPPAISKSAGERSVLSFEDAATESAAESTYESCYESAPETTFRSSSVPAPGMNDSFAPSSAASLDGREELYPANTTALTTTSSDCTRPSTPSLSLSSGEINSPEMSLLDTPNIGLEKHAAMLCFDSDGSADFGFDARGGYEADSEPDNSESGHFGQLLHDKKSSGRSLAGQSLFGQSLTVPIPNHHCDLSEAGSTPTEIGRGATTTDDIHIASDNMSQLLNFDSKAEIDGGPSLARSIDFKNSFEDFAMTKPTLDLDEYAEIVADSDHDSEHDSEQQLFEDEAMEQDLPVDGIAPCDFDRLQNQPSQVDLEPEIAPTFEALLEFEATPEPEAPLEVSAAPDPELSLGFEATLAAEAVFEVQDSPKLAAASDLEAAIEPKSTSEVGITRPVEVAPEIAEIEVTYDSEAAPEPTVETFVEPECPINNDVDNEPLDVTDDAILYGGAELIPLPESDDGLEEEVGIEEAETPTLADTVIFELATDDQTTVLSTEVNPEEDATVAIKSDHDATADVVESEADTATDANANSEDKLVDEAPIATIVEVAEEASIAEEAESDSVSIQHVEFAAVLPTEAEIEPTVQDEAPASQEALPIKPAAVDEVAESEDIADPVVSDVTDEPLQQSVEDPEQSPASWLQLTVPETETTTDSVTYLEEGTPLILAEPSSDEILLSLTQEESTTSGILEELELPSEPDTQFQLEEADNADVLEQVAERAPVPEHVFVPDEVSVQDINTGDLVAPPTPDVKLPEPTSDIIDENVDSTSVSPDVDSALESDEPMGAKTETVAEVLVESSLEANEQPTCEPATPPEAVAAPPTVLHAPVIQDTVELGVASALTLAAKSILGYEQLQVFDTEIKSLPLDSVLRPATLAPIVEQLSAPEKCDVPLVDESGRDSIDSIHDIVEPEAVRPAPKRITSWSLPRSGLLGLDETRLVKVGLRGALTGSTAFDNVPFSIKKRRAPLTIEAATGEAEDDVPIDQLPTASSRKPPLSRRIQSEAVVAHAKSLPKAPKLTRSASVSPKEIADAANSAGAQEGMLPRVVIAFASMAIMSQMINKSS
ncbi:hypothetical protein SCUCBS95973_004482 [Sporothrix curviconia]|uniref:Pt repeat family protein n=1 Tax=Sporothrix curviconia TaxID=1260050 RepID=A0ABP0BP73_9PEZI